MIRRVIELPRWFPSFFTRSLSYLEEFAYVFYTLSFQFLLDSGFDANARSVITLYGIAPGCLSKCVSKLMRHVLTGAVWTHPQSRRRMRPTDRILLQLGVGNQPPSKSRGAEVYYTKPTRETIQDVSTRSSQVASSSNYNKYVFRASRVCVLEAPIVVQPASAIPISQQLSSVH